MSKPASRVIGIIRIAEPPEFGVDLSVAEDESTLGSLLSGLVGHQAAALDALPDGGRWQCRGGTLCRPAGRSAIRANLACLHQELEREYLELTTH